MKYSLVILLVAALLGGCRKGVPHPDAPHPRVVTFSPAITEIVFDMGLGDHIVGVTKYCRLPDGVKRTVVGDHLNVRAEPIVAVEPDVVLTQTALKHFQTVQRLDPDIRIEPLEIESLNDIAEAMERIGTILGRGDKGREAKAGFLEKLQAVSRQVEGLPRPRVLFVNGYRNPMTGGKGTFIHELIEVAGGVNVAAEKFEGWKPVSLESVLQLAPVVIICQCDEGKEVQARRYWQDLMSASAGSSARVHAVTDRYWTIPTGRMARGIVGELTRIIHPELRGGPQR